MGAIFSTQYNIEITLASHFASTIATIIRVPMDYKLGYLACVPSKRCDRDRNIIYSTF